MEKGYVECTMTTCAVTGAAGSGKTCTMYLMLNEPPPKVRQSTGMVEPVRALSTIVGAGISEPGSSEPGSSQWSRVNEDTILDKVAGYTLVQNAVEQPTAHTSTPSPSDGSPSTSLAPQDVHEPVSSSPLAASQDEQSSPLASSQDMHTAKQPIRSSEAGSFSPPATAQDLHTEEKPYSSSKAEQVSKSDQASHTVIDEQLKKLADLLDTLVGRKRVTELHFLYFLDSGGQPQFHDLLPSFLPNLSTILFVLKLSETLDQHPVIEYFQEGKSVCSYQSPYSHEQILKHCIRALQTQNRSIEGGSSPHVTVVGTHKYQCESKKENFQKLFDCLEYRGSPRIAVVGTHKDLESECKRETREEKNKKLLRLLKAKFGPSLIFLSPKELIFALNSLDPSDDDKGLAGKLRKEILSSASKPVQIPLPWFILEQVLRKLAKGSGGVMHIDECRKIASSLHIESSAFAAALKYLVRLNVFLHYPAKLPNAVFCVPQVFLDKINKLVQYHHFLCGSSSTLPGSDESTEAKVLSGSGWIRFQKYGVFRESYLADTFSSHYCNLFTPADFLELLEFLLIAGKVNTTEIDPEYIMPSLLPVLESDDLDNHRCHPVKSHAAPLLVHFPGEWPASGVFCSFLASLLSTKDWKVMMNETTNEPICVCRNCFTFNLPETPVSITLIDSFDQGYFEVHVDAPLEECIKYCPEIQRSVFAALPPKAPVQAEVAFFCPNLKDTRCRSSLHRAGIHVKSCKYWYCSEDQRVKGSLDPNMMVWKIAGNSASGIAT